MQGPSTTDGGGVLVCEKKPRLFSLSDAGAELGIAKRTLWNLIAAKRIAGVRVGDKWYLTREVVEEIAAKGVPSPSVDDDPSGDSRR